MTSHFDDWAEPATGVSSQIYDLENFAGAHRLIRGNTMTPTFMRGPGESVAAFVLESAMDELAHELEIDPVELRLMNHGPNDPRGNPWSSDGLPECLRRGAELFGWDKRNPTPRSRRDGDWLIGHGMAAAGYPVALFMPEQQARARIYSDGSAVIEAGTPEFGTGVGTMMTQVAADALGLPSKLSATSSATAICRTSPRRRLRRLDDGQRRCARGGERLAPTGHRSGRLRRAVPAPRRRRVPSASRRAPDAAREARCRRELADCSVATDGHAEAIGSWRPPPLDTPRGLLTFGAQFAEVAVDPDLGLVRVRRMLGVFAPGRVLNPKLARSQLMGGMLWGLSQALLEGNPMDSRSGRWGAISFGEYLVPVNADAPEITIEFVEVQTRASIRSG